MAHAPPGSLLATPRALRPRAAADRILAFTGFSADQAVRHRRLGAIIKTQEAPDRVGSCRELRSERRGPCRDNSKRHQEPADDREPGSTFVRLDGSCGIAELNRPRLLKRLRYERNDSCGHHRPQAGLAQPTARRPTSTSCSCRYPDAQPITRHAASSRACRRSRQNPSRRCPSCRSPRNRLSATDRTPSAAPRRRSSARSSGRPRDRRCGRRPS